MKVKLKLKIIFTDEWDENTNTKMIKYYGLY